MMNAAEKEAEEERVQIHRELQHFQQASQQLLGDDIFDDVDSMHDTSTWAPRAGDLQKTIDEVLRAVDEAAKVSTKQRPTATPPPQSQRHSETARAKPSAATHGGSLPHNRTHQEVAVTHPFTVSEKTMANAPVEIASLLQQIVPSTCRSLKIAPSSRASHALALNLAYQRVLKLQLDAISRARKKLKQEQATLLSHRQARDRMHHGFLAAQHRQQQDATRDAGPTNPSEQRHHTPSSSDYGSESDDDDDDDDDDPRLDEDTDLALYRSQLSFEHPLLRSDEHASSSHKTDSAALPLFREFSGESNLAPAADDFLATNNDRRHDATNHPENLSAWDQRSFFHVDGFGSPPLSDAGKEALVSFKSMWSFCHEKHWSPADVKALGESVHRELQRVLRERVSSDPKYNFLSELQLTEYSAEHMKLLKSKHDAENRIRAAKLLDLTQEVDESKDIDWTVVAIQLEGKTPEDCRVKWVCEVSPKWNKKKWTKTEDKRLLQLVSQHPTKSWSWYASMMTTSRSPIACFCRYQQSLNSSTHKGKWTKEEDALLKRSVARNGDKHWMAVSRDLASRTPTQVMDRWRKSVNPEIPRRRWTPGEDRLLQKGIERFGTQWARVQRFVPGRTDTQCRERHSNIMQKKYSGEWTQEMDDKLLECVQKHGKKWSVVAAQMRQAGFPKNDKLCLLRWQLLRPAEFWEHKATRQRKKKLLMTNFSGSHSRHMAKSELTLGDVESLYAADAVSQPPAVSQSEPVSPQQQPGVQRSTTGCSNVSSTNGQGHRHVSNSNTEEQLNPAKKAKEGSSIRD